MAEIKYVDWDGLVYYHGKVTELINDKLEEVIKVGGDVTFAELPDPSFQNLNYIYKVTDKFVVPNNGRFDETLGLECPANTVLRVTNVEDTYLYTIFYKPTSETGNYDLDELLRRVDSLEESIEENSSKVGQLESELTSQYYTKDEVDSLTKYTNDDGQEVTVVSEVKTLTKAVENLGNGSITYDTW